MVDLVHATTREGSAPGRHPEPLETYREFVASVAAKADGQVIMNRHQGHASVIMAQLLASSHDEVDFLTGGLDPVVYGTPAVIDAARSFFERNPNAKIRVLHETPLNSPHPFIDALETYAETGRFSVKLVPQKLATFAFHFAVGDQKNIRFEGTKGTFEAAVMFGADDTGQKLMSFFNALDKSILVQNAEPQLAL